MSRYVTAAELWQGSRDPYSDGVGSPATPHKPRSVVRDVFAGLYQLYTAAWADSKLALIPIFALTFVGLPIGAAFYLAYWAMWEKLATYWWHTTGRHLGRTKESFSIPMWHRYCAMFVGAVWGLLFAVIFIIVIGSSASLWDRMASGGA